jgi:hypothetical protein
MLKKIKIINSFAYILIAISFLLFGLVFTIPFFPLTLVTKGFLASGMYVTSEITLLIGVAIVGKQVVSKFKRYLNPLNWFSEKQTKKSKNAALSDSSVRGEK